MKLTRRQMAVMAQQAEGELLRAGVFAPFYGQREDAPTVSLNESFTSEGENVIFRNGVAERVKMRLPEFLETAFGQGTITASNGSKTITASEGAGTFSSAAGHKPYWVGRKIVITDTGVDTEYTIASVSDAGDTLDLTENYAETGGAGLAYSIGTAGTKVATPDANPALRYHRLVIGSSGSESEYFLAFTKAHVYLWSTSWSAWMLKHTCASDCEEWDTTAFDNQVIATNNVDKVLCWGSTVANALAALDGASGLDIGGATYITAAKYVEAHENYVHVGCVTIGGTVYDNKWHWCSKDDETDWDLTGAGDCGYKYIENAGPMRGMISWGTYLVIGMEKRVRGYWLVTDSDVWNGETLSENGLRANNSMVIDRDEKLYYLARDYTIRKLPEGTDVSEALNVTLRNINPSLEEFVQSKWIDELGQIWWSVPDGSAATGNNKVIWYDPGMKRWGEIDLAISAFGEYTRQTVYTWGTWPFTEWGKIAWDTWDGPQNVIGFPLDIGGDYSGHTHTLHSAELDDGSAYTGYFVFNTDLMERIIAKRLGVSLREYKRIVEVEIVAYSENAGTIALHVKRDAESDWQSVGSASLIDTARDIVTVSLTDADIRLRHAEFKVSGSNRFRFIGIMFGFIRDGSR